MKITLETSHASFIESIASPILDHVPTTSLLIIYKSIQSNLRHAAREEEKKLEKKMRRRMDDFRYAMRKCDPVITLSSKWEDVKDTTEKFEEYAGLSETHRIEAFEKYLRRLKVCFCRLINE